MTIFRKTIWVSQNTPARISIGPFVTEKQPFKRLKNKSILARHILKTKSFQIFKFPWSKHFARGLSYLKYWHISLRYCWNYGSSNLLFHFTDVRVVQLNKRQTKLAVKLAIHFLQRYYQKKCLLKVSSFFTQAAKNNGPLKISQNWTETAFKWLIFSTTLNFKHLI